MIATLAATLLLSAPPAPGSTAARVAQDATVLAADDMEGRQVGTPGYDRAAAYVAGRMTQIGLAPGDDDGDYRLPMALVRTAAPTPASVVVGGKTYTHGKNAVIQTDPALSANARDYELVFVGDGYDIPQYGGTAYGDVDVAGKIAIVVPFAVSAGPADVKAHLQQSLGSIVADKGAKGVIFLLPPALPGNVWENILANANNEGGSLGLADDDGRPFEGLDGLDVFMMLKGDANDALFAGSSLKFSDVFDAIRQRQPLTPTALPARVQLTAAPAAIEERIESDNVVGILEGSDPALGDEILVVTAHLDHVGIDPEHEGDDKIFNGAFDNALGVASMLEAARQIASSGTPPRRSIAFVALAAEEVGLYGSADLARRGTIAGKRIVGNVNLDMPLTLTPFDKVIAFGAEHSTLGPDVAATAADMGLTIIEDPSPEEVFFVRSDHYSFVKAGIPSVMLDVWPTSEPEKVAREFMETWYHGPDDEIALITDWAPTAMFADLNAKLITRIANREAAPQWYADSYFGQALAPDLPKATRP